MSDDVTTLVSALITKMERMDAQIDVLRKEVANPDIILKRAGLVHARSPTATDVWGDPLRGDIDEVITKAVGEVGDSPITMPNTNEEWKEMSWDDIHVMAEQAAGTEGRN